MVAVYKNNCGAGVMGVIEKMEDVIKDRFRAMYDKESPHAVEIQILQNCESDLAPASNPEETGDQSMHYDGFRGVPTITVVVRTGLKPGFKTTGTMFSGFEYIDIGELSKRRRKKYGISQNEWQDWLARDLKGALDNPAYTMQCDSTKELRAWSEILKEAGYVKKDGSICSSADIDNNVHDMCVRNNAECGDGSIFVGNVVHKGAGNRNEPQENKLGLRLVLFIRFSTPKGCEPHSTEKYLEVTDVPLFPLNLVTAKLELTTRAQIEKKRQENTLAPTDVKDVKELQRELRLKEGLHNATIKQIYGDGNCQFNAVCALIPSLLNSMSASDYATYSESELYRKLKNASIMSDGHLQLRQWVCDVLESIIFTPSELEGHNDTIMLVSNDDTDLRNNLIRHFSESVNEVTRDTVKEYLVRMRLQHSPPTTTYGDAATLLVLQHILYPFADIVVHTTYAGKKEILTESYNVEHTFKLHLLFSYRNDDAAHYDAIITLNTRCEKDKLKSREIILNQFGNCNGKLEIKKTKKDGERGLFVKPGCFIKPNTMITWYPIPENAECRYTSPGQFENNESTQFVYKTYGGEYFDNKEEAASRTEYDVTTDTYTSTTLNSEWAGLAHFANSADNQIEHNCTMEHVQTYAPHGPFVKMMKNEKTQQEEAVALEVVTLKVLIAGRNGIHEKMEILPKYNRAAEIIRRRDVVHVGEGTVLNEDVEDTDEEDGEGPVRRRYGRRKVKKEGAVKRGPVKAIRKVETDCQRKGTRRRNRPSDKDIKVEAQESAPKKQKMRKTPATNTPATKTQVVQPKVVTAKVVTPRVPKPLPRTKKTLEKDSATEEKERQYLNRIQILESDQRQLKEEQMKMNVAAALHEKELGWEQERGRLNLRLAEENGNTMLFGAAYQSLNNFQLNEGNQQRIQQSMAFAKEILMSGVTFEALGQAQQFMFGGVTTQTAVSNVTTEMFARMSAQHVSQLPTAARFAVLGAPPVQQTNALAPTPTHLLSIGAPAPTNLAIGPAPPNLAVKDEPKNVPQK